MNKIRMIKLKGYLPQIIMLCIFAMFGLIMFVVSNHDPEQPVEWESVDFTEDINGLYVHGTLYGIYDSYAEETADGSVTAYEYIIDANEECFMGLRVKKKDFEPIENLLQVSIDYMNGEIDADIFAESKIEVYGTIKKMPEQSWEYYKIAVDWDSMTEEQQAIHLPYYLVLNEGGEDTSGAAGFGLIFMIFSLMGMAIFVGIALFTKDESIEKYIKNSGQPELARERVEVFLQTATDLHGSKYDDEFIFGALKGKITFGKFEDIVWTYINRTRIRIWFIPINMYVVKIVFKDGSTQDIGVTFAAQAGDIITIIQQKCPFAIVGYSDDLLKLSKRNFKEFLNLKYNAKAYSE